MCTNVCLYACGDLNSFGAFDKRLKKYHNSYDNFISYEYVSASDRHATVRRMDGSHGRTKRRKLTYEYK